MGILDLPTINKIASEVQSVINNNTRNLFNKNDVILGKRLQSPTSTSLTDTEGYYVSYVPVDRTINSKITVKYAGNAYSYCAQCDNEKNIINGTQFKGNSATAVLNENCAYLLVCSTVDTIATQIVNYGETIYEKSIYGTKIDVSLDNELTSILHDLDYDREIKGWNRFVNKGKNLFDKNNIISGKYLNTDLGITSNSTYYMSYVPVDISLGTSVSVKTAGYSTTAICAQCDIDKIIIPHTSFSGSNQTVSLSNNCKYLLISGFKGVLDSQIVNYGDSVDESALFDVPATINTEVQNVVKHDSATLNFSEFDKNLVNQIEFKKGISLNENGEEYSDAYTVNSQVSGFITIDTRISNIIKFFVIGTGSQENMGGVCFYDVNKSFISKINSVNKTIGYFEMPENCRYLRFVIVKDAIALLKYGCFTFNPLELIPYSGGNSDNIITPDDIISTHYMIINDETGEVTLGSQTSSTGSRSVTTLIPVKPNTDYFMFGCKPGNVAGSYNTGVMFGADKKFIGYMSSIIPDETPERSVRGWNNVFHTPNSVYYVAFNIFVNVSYNTQKDWFIGMVETDKWNGVVGKTINETDRVRIAVANGTFPCAKNRILGVYDSFIALSDHTEKRILFSANGWGAKSCFYVKGGSKNVPEGWASYDLNSTNFEGYNGESVIQVIFFNGNGDSNYNRATLVTKCLILATNNKIWYCEDVRDVHNLTFGIPDIWDSVYKSGDSLFGNKSWRIDANGVGNSQRVDGVTRYKKYYPSDTASRQNKFYWHNGPLWYDGIGGQYSRGVSFCNYTDAMGSTTPNPSCLFFTENAKDIYVMYEFGVHPKKYKKAGDNTIYTTTAYSKGDVVDVSDTDYFAQDASFESLVIRRVMPIIPSEAEKDPTELFSLESSIEVTSVSGTTFTLNDATGIEVGDVIIFAGSGLTGGYEKLVTSTIDSITKTPNGNMFVITSVDGNNVTINDAVGNPKNNLFCRHIHGLNTFGQGICLYTGEEYPESWFIYINPYIESIYSDGRNANNPQWVDDVVRLNSSENGYQRSLGVYLRNDGKMIYIADSNSPKVAKLTVRGKDIKFGNFGLMIFPLSDIDDSSTAMTKISGVNAGYALWNLNGVLLFSDYYGKTYYSEDEGDTWTYLCRDLHQKSKCLGFDRYAKRFYFDAGGLNEDHIIVEIK